jgi:hypothetical protein
MAPVRGPKDRLTVTWVDNACAFLGWDKRLDREVAGVCGTLLPFGSMLVSERALEMVELIDVAWPTTGERHLSRVVLTGR